MTFKLVFISLTAALFAALWGCNGGGGNGDRDADVSTDGDVSTEGDVDIDGLDIPIDDGEEHEFLWGAYPPTTLLPPQSEWLSFSVNSTLAASCGYAIGEDLSYEAMTPFTSGQGTTAHETEIRGLTPDTRVVNEVYIRCDAQPDFLLHLRYRSLPETSASFPRTGNLWGSWGLKEKGLEYCARIDLFLGAGAFDPDELVTLRDLNPNILVLTSINTVEHADYQPDEIPEDYYLLDVNGNRIEVWPGAYRLNLTRLDVAEYQARYAYGRILDNNLMFDGCFFDNFFTSQSWLSSDIYGNTVQLDANGDTVEDDPDWLDEAWRQGVFHELETWRWLMPWALASGHHPRPPPPEIGAIFNGDSIGFMTADVIEGRRPFGDLWDTYQGWWEVGRTPVITMIESSPPDQIAYGYNYSPLEHIPESTLEFARTYYPYVRFGLAVTLMNDGYFAHEFGDTWHGNDWWYDELDYDLGPPCGPAARVDVGTVDPTDTMDNGGFEADLEGTWNSWVSPDGGAEATFTRDTSEHAEGSASALINVTNAGEGVDWHVSLSQNDRPLVQGVIYDLEFWAKADAARQVTVSAQKGAPDWRNYGLWRRLSITTEWKQYIVAFEANETANDARIQFHAGASTGNVWIDGVRLVQHPPDVFMREYANGLAVLNGSRDVQTINVGAGFSRLTGDQAPRYEYILDDVEGVFTFTGSWNETVYDSGMWQASGPFYHNWGDGCHQLDGTSGEAQWDLAVRADDTYTIAAWWPAAPESSTWSSQVVFEVVSDGAVAASATLDQTSGGDEWHFIAETALSASVVSFIRIQNNGTGPAIADALHVRSASRYNDGSAAPSVILESMDGIVLKRDGDPPPDCLP